MPCSTASSDAHFSTDILRYCDDLLSARLGIHFPADRLNDLGWHVEQLLERMALPNVSALITRLQQPIWPSLMQQQLVEQLTVGETYFFRDPALFKYLQEHWLPALLAQRRRDGNRSLRIWSAGCCSGEEVYSLAAVVWDLLPDASQWDLQFIGTDINPFFLQCAKTGVYRAWSFRQPDSRWRDRYCRKESNGDYRIASTLRQGVSFFQLNLTETVYPDALHQLLDCDLILCRNVLMYFKLAQAGDIIRRLQQCLTAQGVLLLAPAEAILCQSAGVRARNWPQAVSLQRDCPLVSANVADAPDEFAPSVARCAPARAMKADHWSQPELALPVVADIKQVLAQARSYANRGAYRQALHWANLALELDKLQPGSYWLLANIEWENNNVQATLQALRHVLYLQPDFVLAHFLIGRVYDCIANHVQAGHHYAICLSFLEKLPLHSELEHGEGLTAAQCRQWLLHTQKIRQQKSMPDVRH